MENKEKEEVVQAYKIPLMLGLAVVLGMFFGMFVANKKFPTSESQSKTEKFGQIIHAINQDYVDSVGLDSLLDASIQSMLSKLDPHTVYVPKSQSVLQNASLKKNFEGIGVEFRVIKDTLFVTKVIKEGPSAKAGLKAGDKVLIVNDSSIVGVEMATIFNLVRGEKGTAAKLLVRRKSENIEINVVRGSIRTYAVQACHLVDSVTGYIKLRRFAEGAKDEVVEGIVELKKKGMQQLIIDLRDNGGGYLHEVIPMAEHLLTEGDLIMYTKGKRKAYDESYVASKEGVFSKGKLVLLINEGSASASEVLSGAIQDNDRGIIVGRRSFGKGLVQDTRKFSDGSEMRITIARYYTPSGRCIQKPYNDSTYDLDFYNRILSGELYIEDSVQYNDDQVFRTKKGKLVYGGGGIHPDYFVPQDTTMYNGILANIYKKQLLNEYVPMYYEKYQDTLSQLIFDDYLINFTFSQTQTEEFETYLKLKLQDEFNKEELLEVFPRVKLELKALIARLIWDDNEYYAVMNQRDKMMLKAKEVFNKK